MLLETETISISENEDDPLYRTDYPPGDWLVSSEIAELNSYKRSERRNEWYAARIAAKKLLCRFYDRLTEKPVKPSDFEIWRHEEGPPQCRFSPTLHVPDFNRRIRISLAHCSDRAVAGLSIHGYPGIDIERFRNLDDSFRELCFSPEEVQITEKRGIKLISLWTLKEAAFKSLCLGLAVEARSIEITEIDSSGKVSMRLSKDADEQMKKLGGRFFEAHLNISGTHALAETLIRE